MAFRILLSSPPSSSSSSYSLSNTLQCPLMWSLLVVIISALVAANTSPPHQQTSPTPILHQFHELPDTSAIDGQLTANLGVDHFFSLWLVFNNDDIKTSNASFTIFAPQNSATKRAEKLIQQPDRLKKLLLDHVVLGGRQPSFIISLKNTAITSPLTGEINSTTTTTTTAAASIKTKETTLITLSGREVRIEQDENDGIWRVNGARVVEHKNVGSNGLLVVVDSYLFADDVKEAIKDVTIQTIDRSTVQPLNGSQNFIIPSEDLSKRTVLGHNKISSSNVDVTVAALSSVLNQTSSVNATFVENVMEVLSFLKSGARVFQHFLLRSNVSKLLKEGEEYTVFVPTDYAFQRWHPIDWGFYPFSVPEFTESIIVNHFVRGRIRQDDIKDGDKVKTIGGREIIFRRTPNLFVNGATVINGDTPVAHGNIMFIGEVLYVSESVVSKLHQQHKDKETPPLLAFPWFGAQFLSHAFLALERDKRFGHVTRFLNLADLAPHVSGAGYTFFVPIDTAFEELGLDKMPDNYLSTGEGLEILLNHFVKGRLYDRELLNGTVLTTLGNKTITIKRTDSKNVRINDATIVESEVFVYNLGTMYYIDKVLFAPLNMLPAATGPPPPLVLPVQKEFTKSPHSETLPDELIDDSGDGSHQPDVLMADIDGVHTTVIGTSTTATSIFSTTSTARSPDLEETKKNGTAVKRLGA